VVDLPPLARKEGEKRPGAAGPSLSEIVRAPVLPIVQARRRYRGRGSTPERGRKEGIRAGGRGSAPERGRVRRRGRSRRCRRRPRPRAHPAAEKEEGGGWPVGWVGEGVEERECGRGGWVKVGVRRG
jgi:hypothetical protein